MQSPALEVICSRQRPPPHPARAPPRRHRVNPPPHCTHTKRTHVSTQARPALRIRGYPHPPRRSQTPTPARPRAFARAHAVAPARGRRPTSRRCPSPGASCRRGEAPRRAPPRPRPRARPLGRPGGCELTPAFPLPAPAGSVRPKSANRPPGCQRRAGPRPSRRHTQEPLSGWVRNEGGRRGRGSATLLDAAPPGALG